MIRTITFNRREHQQLPKDVKERLVNWTPPKVPISDVFDKKAKGLFEFRPSYAFKELEKTVPIRGDCVHFHLLDSETISRHMKNYEHINFGLVQVGVKPLTRTGLNCKVLVCIRDSRLLKFKESLLGIVESSLDNGPIYFNSHPNYPILLKDLLAHGGLSLCIKTIGSRENGYPIWEDDVDVAVVYRVYYKLMTSRLMFQFAIVGGDAKVSQSFIKNTVIRTNLLTTGVPVAKTTDLNSVEELENGDFRIKSTT